MKDIKFFHLYNLLKKTHEKSVISQIWKGLWCPDCQPGLHDFLNDWLVIEDGWELYITPLKTKDEVETLLAEIADEDTLYLKKTFVYFKGKIVNFSVESVWDIKLPT